jgi:POT family proton-dependent oligopeptide transporter
LVGVGAGFLVLVPAALQAGGSAQVSPMWLTATYLIHTWAELSLSPVGLSSMTKLAPVRIAGLMMGVWYLGSSVGNYIAGQLAGFYEEMPLAELFGAVSVLPIAGGLVMLLLSRKFARMMHGVK